MYQEPEIWRPIRHFPNMSVSSYGRVFNSDTQDYVKTAIDRKTHDVWVAFEYYDWAFHGPVWRLMLVAFYNAVDFTLLSPDFVDGDPRNLNVFNLRWNLSDGTPVIFRREDTGDWKRLRRMARRVQIIETGEIYDSVRACAQAISGDANAIYICLRGDGRSRTHHGFTFRYLDA